MADSEHVRILLDDVEYERFQHSESGRLDAVGADLRTQNLSGRRLQDVDFTGADLRGTNFFMSRLSGVTFRDAKLDGALLSEADVFDCDLVSADFSNVSLTGTTILKGDASMARFQNASLAWAAFRGIKLEGANFTDAYAYRTVWAALDLQAVRGLDKMSHGGPSTVGLDTVQASASRIPKSFLQDVACQTSSLNMSKDWHMRSVLSGHIRVSLAIRTGISVFANACIPISRHQACGAGSPQRI